MMLLQPGQNSRTPENGRVLGLGAGKKLRFVPLAEFIPDEKQAHELRAARARSHAEVTAAVVDSGAVPVRELAGIVTDYALKRQLRHFVAFEPPQTQEDDDKVPELVAFFESDVERAVRDAPDFICPGDVVHVLNRKFDNFYKATPAVAREAVLIGASPCLFTPTGAVDTLSEVSDELTKMGLTFDALNEAGMYNLRHDKHLERWNQPIAWRIWSPVHIGYGYTTDFPSTNLVARLSANNDAQITYHHTNMMLRCPKKDTCI